MVPLRVGGRELRPHKASVSPTLGARNVLTKEPWTFVALWLTRRKSEAAVHYWEQARQFYKRLSICPFDPLLCSSTTPT